MIALDRHRRRVISRSLIYYQIPLPKNLLITSIKDLLRVAVPTCNVPVSPDGNYRVQSYTYTVTPRTRTRTRTPMHTRTHTTRTESTEALT